MSARIAWAVALAILAVLAPAADQHTRRVTWQDVVPLQSQLGRYGYTAGNFAARIEQLAADNARRVRLGDLDHLVFYLLQSTRFTDVGAIEPALSAKALVERLPAHARDAFLDDPSSARDHIPADVTARTSALLQALASPRGDQRLSYFASLIAETAHDDASRERLLRDEYLRVMRFVYEKEFGAGRADAAAAARLYRTRGLSTDTAVEAGFLVSQGLGVLRGLDPARRIRRVLIVGAGLDLAPRTALLESAPPQSYQPWAILDALVGLGLASLDDLELVVADINPRVVSHVRAMRTTPPTLTLLTGLAEGGSLAFVQEYLEYFDGLGHAIGIEENGQAPVLPATAVVPAGHRYKRVQVSARAARAVRAERLDIVTERLVHRERDAAGAVGDAFDLVIATNVFPYFDDDGLMLAVGNIAGMLRDGGVLLHNEARPALGGMASAVGLPPSQSRHAVIATVRGAPPLGDSVWLHVRRGAAPP